MSCLLVGLALARLPLVAPADNRTPPRIRIVPQHSGRLIQDIEESQDGTRLVTHDKGAAPRLWDARRQILLRVLDGHPDAVALVNFSPDGRRVLTRSPQEIRVWDSVRAKPLFTVAVPEGDRFTAAVFSPDGATVAFGTEKGSVSLYDTAAQAAKKLGAHTKAVRGLAFNSAGTQFVSGSDDATARLWDAKTGAPGASLTGHKGAIRWFDFSPRGDMLLATSLDDTASLWDAKGKALATYPHVIGERGVANVQMAALFAGKDMAEVAACGKDGTIHLYKPGQTQASRALSGHTKSVREIRRSRDGRYLSTYGDDESLRMWDAVAGKELEFNPEDGLPTAGEFSPNREVFWLGYSRGEVRQFDLKTGKATKETFGAVAPISSSHLVGDGTVYWKGEPSGSVGLATGPSQYAFVDAGAGHKNLALHASFERVAISPDGRYLAANSRGGTHPFQVVDLWEDRLVLTGKSMQDYAWSPDSKRIAVLDGDLGIVALYDLKTAEPVAAKEWPTDKEWGGLGGPAWHPNGKWIATLYHPGKRIKIWDWQADKEVHSFGKFDDTLSEVSFFDKGRKIVLRGWTSTVVYDIATGKEVWADRSEEPYLESKPAQASSDTKRIALNAQKDVVVLDAAGKEIFRIPNAKAFALSPNGKRLLASRGKGAVLWDVDTKQELLSLPHSGEVMDCGVAGDRFTTSDDIGGFHVWNLKGERLATMVAMKDGGWLAYDDQGRYDASDPSQVSGAYFVLEWAGGLEPIAMPQLKAQFYEPHLLAKALGNDKEPLRDVPTLESLRLFPALTVKRGEGQTFEIESAERDNGGIGQVRVSINGKEVARKRGTGFFKLDVADYANFLLPETLLKDGQKNLLSVTVSNEAGDLVSPPEVHPIALPSSLKAPEVKLYALCAGIGDYAGNSGDLQAPPSDAEAIGRALREVSSRLLPNRTEVEVMTTAGDAKRPTRENILAWLKATSAKATSSDIVFVFVAGHGMSRIGDQSGYFMLTSEADPGDITPASAKTGAISGEELRQALAAIPAGKQVVILDTCHSGAAAGSLLASSRSVSSEYQRAWEAIKDTTGTWLLAGAASDQLSYESPNVDHGMLTYALLEAVDKGSAEGLRKTPSGQLFVDVERWMEYAANRVESLKNEVGIKGVQRPEFKRATRGATFDIGVMDEARKGFLELRAPMPIVIVGNFQQDQEDPLNLEEAVNRTMKEGKTVKPWFEMTKHPGVYRMAGEYTVDGEAVKVRLILQIFDESQQRKNLETVEVLGTKADLPALALKIRTEIETRIKARTKQS
ncbi:MAG: caspase family protein [Fimbriimonas sp.]